MAYVRGHYRNGRYVRSHNRRTKGAAPSAPRRARQSRPAPTQPPSGSTTHVRGHYRNGRYVQPHQRRITAPAAAAAATAGGGGLLLFFLLLAVLSGK